jgi:3-carboxy-cis,cis-muconate cycloisomerase
MMGLAPALGRQVAHDLVYDCCRAVLTGGLTGDTPFLDALAAEPKIAAVIDRAALARLVDPANYLGAAPEMTRNLLARRRK